MFLFHWRIFSNNLLRKATLYKIDFKYLKLCLSSCFIDNLAGYKIFYRSLQVWLPYVLVLRRAEEIKKRWWSTLGPTSERSLEEQWEGNC